MIRNLGHAGVVGVLDEPLRRRMYLYIRRAHRPVTREEAARRVGISRKLAAFHLERLVDAGLLVAASGVPGRSRGRGRAPKSYWPSAVEIELSIPERRYDLAGAMLIAALTDCQRGEAPRDAAIRVAREHGRALGRAGRGRGLRSTLENLGFEPDRHPPDGRIVLHSCPFHALAQLEPELMCGMNEALLAGLLEGLGGDPTTAVLAPAPGRCCVELVEAVAGT